MTHYAMSAAARLPRAAVDRPVSAERALLLVHDMHDPHRVAEPVEHSPVAELAHNVGKLCDTCRDLRVPVLHSTGGLDFGALRELLDRDGRDQLLVTGYRAHAACLMAAAGPLLAGVSVYCVADAVADVSLDDHQAAVRAAADHGATPTTTGRVIGQLLGVLP
ncbi:isochorismatase family protein [Actinokineospora sp. NBRC 105648]|uniref:isochorismatase family protein n=1 Tax=Actinokineospora sp. NBRC 105648 TaxID=3032206 RepID=UPI0024A182AB|nr:isochorismatase family protein [Actinokineospora sp. NBRC 105648]GLZ38796.1 hypothetical protein Acsp05_24200 [Actinokineospora sp. NBRC 105648]